MMPFHLWRCHRVQNRVTVLGSNECRSALFLRRRCSPQARADETWLTLSAACWSTPRAASHNAYPLMMHRQTFLPNPSITRGITVYCSTSKISDLWHWGLRSAPELNLLLLLSYAMYACSIIESSPSFLPLFFLPLVVVDMSGSSLLTASYGFCWRTFTNLEIGIQSPVACVQWDIDNVKVPIRRKRRTLSFSDLLVPRRKFETSFARRQVKKMVGGNSTHHLRESTRLMKHRSSSGILQIITSRRRLSRSSGHYYSGAS